MKEYNVIFADLDGTLINTISGETFPKGIWDMKIRFDVLDAIKALHPQYILIVSNQGGIESGFVDADNFRSKSEYIARAIREYCDCECYGMYCTTNDKTDLYRKPNVRMLADLLETYVGDDFDCIKQKSLMIGDASGKRDNFQIVTKRLPKTLVLTIWMSRISSMLFGRIEMIATHKIKRINYGYTFIIYGFYFCCFCGFTV